MTYIFWRHFFPCKLKALRDNEILISKRKFQSHFRQAFQSLTSGHGLVKKRKSTSLLDGTSVNKLDREEIKTFEKNEAYQETKCQP